MRPLALNPFAPFIGEHRHIHLLSLLDDDDDDDNDDDDDDNI